MLSSIWDIGTPEVFDYATQEIRNVFGEPFKVRLVFIKFGAFPIELLQPLDNKSIWSKFIAEKGEGIHHVALGVSNYDEMMTTTQKKGHKLLVAAEFNGENGAISIVIRAESSLNTARNTRRNNEPAKST